MNLDSTVVAMVTDSRNRFFESKKPYNMPIVIIEFTWTWVCCLATALSLMAIPCTPPLATTICWMPLRKVCK